MESVKECSKVTAPGTAARQWACVLDNGPEWGPLVLDNTCKEPWVCSDVCQMSTFYTQLQLYLRMIKFAHSIFALPLALIAVVLAVPQSEPGYGQPGTWLLILKIVICMVALRSAAMGFNRLIDARYDAANPRTAVREIPAGLIPRDRAAAFVLVSLTVFILVALTINRLAAILSPVAIIAVLGYSYTKRFTWLCHFFLGLAIGLAPGAAWVAILERIDWLAAYWSLGLMFYIAGFDILYSCQDWTFDRRQGLFSLPARFGVGPALWIARLTHLVALVFFTWAGLAHSAGLVFFGGLVCVALLFVYEHWLVRPDKLDQIPLAFFNVNAIVSTLLFVVVVLDELFRIPTGL
ncbi:MAG: putative 4-hydroxybenzoate polyprenyltransferase [Leptospiraceae bacterium]|nr:putative 4-hydroxybenzoate polyprenyltransferase [Leptospiraceae bacterium]